MYSFTTPRKKSLIDKITWLWLSFIVIMLVALSAFGFFLKYQTSFYEEMLSGTKLTNSKYNSSVSNLDKELKIVDMKKALNNEVRSSNALLKESIKNLFDLVPDQITLNEVVMKKDALFIKGFTPTKDSYKLLLEPPLKSIFNESKVTFSFNGRIGKYQFESMNTINELLK